MHKPRVGGLTRLICRQAARIQVFLGPRTEKPPGFLDERPDQIGFSSPRVHMWGRSNAGHDGGRGSLVSRRLFTITTDWLFHDTIQTDARLLLANPRR